MTPEQKLTLEKLTTRPYLAALHSIADLQKITSGWQIRRMRNGYVMKTLRHKGGTYVDVLDAQGNTLVNGASLRKVRGIGAMCQDFDAIAESNPTSSDFIEMILWYAI